MMPSLKQERIKCAEECVKLANQRFHLTQEIERLNAQIAMLREALVEELKSPSPQSGQVLHKTESDWLTQHDAKIRDDALEEAAYHFNCKPSYEAFGDTIAEEIRSLKGNL